MVHSNKTWFGWSATSRRLLGAGVITSVALAMVILPQQAAHAVGRYVGNLTVDCETDYLEGQSVVYLELGDTFTIENEPYQDCLIEDPDNILTGEDGDFSGLGPDILATGEQTTDITIDSAGTFTITENGGLGDTKTFHVVNGFVFSNPDGDIGEDSLTGDSYIYNEVGLDENGDPIAATVTVTEVSNLVSDEVDVDRNDRPDADAVIGMRILNASTDGGHAEISVSFHEPGNPDNPVTISALSATVKDFDDFQWISVAGASSYLLSSDPVTNLSARTLGSELIIEELGDIGSETEDEDHWAVLNFTNTSEITLRVGDNYPSEDSSSASFNVLFAGAEWTETPVTVELDSSSLADTGVDASGVNVALALAAILTAVGISTTVLSRRRVARGRTNAEDNN